MSSGAVKYIASRYTDMPGGEPYVRPIPRKADQTPMATIAYVCRDIAKIGLRLKVEIMWLPCRNPVQVHDVRLPVTKEPEQMLIEHRITRHRRINRKVAAEIAVGQQHGNRCGKHEAPEALRRNVQRAGTGRKSQRTERHFWWQGSYRVHAC